MVEIENMVESMSLDELCGQVLCYDLSGERWTENEIRNIFSETMPGGIFVFNATKDKIEKLTTIANEYAKVPVIISSDAENGPGGPLKNEVTLPEPMNWGACDDENLIERGGIATAEICRECGIHWSFAPVVDINYNKNAPGTNVRAISDSPHQVAKIAKAYAGGLQKNGLMAAGCKHFPGEGLDDRNCHFCTTVNHLSIDDWKNTYGYVYKEMIAMGINTVMVGHTALPAYQRGKDNEYDEILGYRPATISRALMTDLLKGELGFEGCVVSDAMSMVGACAMIDPDELAVEFLKCGGDMVLFALPRDFHYIKRAVLDGILPLERLKDAVRRILMLKERVRLFDNQERILKCVQKQDEIEDVAREVAEKSITLVRNAKNIFPLNLQKGDRILICNLQGDEKEAARPGSYVLDVLEQELRNRGFDVCALTNAGHRVVEKELEKGCSCVLINCKLSTRDYKGGSLRADWVHYGTFWRGRVFKHSKVVFTSFGDPYKLYEFPYMPTYVNAYGTTPEIQKAFVKLLLGEIDFQGKSPVGMDGFFEREVE